MDSASSGIQNFFAQLASVQVLTEIFAIAIAAALAVIGGRYVRLRIQRSGRTRSSTWLGASLEGTMLAAPMAIGIVALFALHLLLVRLGARADLLYVALQLTLALALVRLATYGLRLMLGRETWFDAWEGRIAIAVWLVIALELLGWLEKIQATLEHVHLIPGRNVFTLWELVKGIVVVTVFVFVTTFVARTVERRVMRLGSIALSTRIGISKFTYFVLLGIGVLLGINAAGVDVTTLNVLTGGIGIGLGFGLQTIAGNFVSGFVLLIDKSIKPGDVISFTGHTGTSTENFGWVQELRGRYVVVRDRDGVETLVPNQNLITNSVINWSYSDKRVRLRLPVMISYDDDPEGALEALLEAVSDHPRILREPAPVTRLMAFEDYGMRLEVRFWIADPMNGVNNVRSDVNRAIWRVFRKRKIRIPVAQRELRMLGPHRDPSEPGG
ncbi:MAG TPA: mechanosensitive ion channel domain-containing protein [Steroidobacteraceae bacterium]|jgi:small-conductance mechanosensitive channel|nr:mechanosensitive ion channel domain-containing protein [Steroidobacteraceae bacterium]